MARAILGISAFYHDSAAALIHDGQIVAAAQEERFSRKKHDAGFPKHAVQYVLEEAGLGPEGIDLVAFYDKPLLKFERLLETYHAFAPRGLRSFLAAMPVWLGRKLMIRREIAEGLADLGHRRLRLLFPEHHLSHAASAFYPSPFPDAAILTVDGVGEWTTCTIGHGRGKDIRILQEQRFPHSVGLLYSAFTQYCGFKVNSGEYKLMGLSAYGTPDSERVQGLRRMILDELVDLREDGSILLNMRYFNFATGLTMCHDARWASLFGVARRAVGSPIEGEHVDLALAAQLVVEEVVLRLAETARRLSGSEYLVMAGGVALNSVASGKLLRSGLFRDIWIQPAAGDAGGAIGAALAAHHIWAGGERVSEGEGRDAMQGAFLGPAMHDVDVTRVIRRYEAPHRHLPDCDTLIREVATLLAQGRVVGWCQGRMEFGPRALGNRSILADPRSAAMQARLNRTTKNREAFRPFAPAVMAEDTQDYFDLDRPSPYMLWVAPVREARCIQAPEDSRRLPIAERLLHARSDIPAVTHVDHSARVQTVARETNPRFWSLLAEFRRQTGCGVLINTSFNVRGEPIVCTADDAYRCFMSTDMDFLVMGTYLFDKNEQRAWPAGGEARVNGELD